MYIAKTLLGTACCLGLILTGPAFGDILNYQITVNTASVSGTTGYIDVGLDPGSLGALGVIAAISDFSGATLSTNTTTSGTVTGTNLYFIDGDVSTTPASSPILLSATNTLTMGNDDPNNELTQALTFGTSLTFDLTLSGPGVSVLGHAGGTSGTTFVLDFLNDAQTAYLLSSDPTGSTASLWATGVISIANSGVVTSVDNPGPGGGPSDEATTLSSETITPEPSSVQLVLMGAGLLILAVSKRRRIAQRCAGRFS
ncbi:MAG: PEP-CTERM sorting domain-containing protein [Bryobacteraceae bacterium]|jgi:hypothetical protein